MITVSTITAICSLPISKSVGYFLPLRDYDIFLRYLLLVGELGASLGKWVLRDHLPAALDYPRVTAFCYSINQSYRPAPLQTLIWRCLLRVPALCGSSQPHTFHLTTSNSPPHDSLVPRLKFRSILIFVHDSQHRKLSSITQELSRSGKYASDNPTARWAKRLEEAPRSRRWKDHLGW